MDAKQILEVIDKLVGGIEPAGATHIDSERADNLKTYLEIWDMMHTKIDDIVYYNQDRHENSVKNMVKLCNEQLDRVGIKPD